MLALEPVHQFQWFVWLSKPKSMFLRQYRSGGGILHSELTCSCSESTDNLSINAEHEK